MSVYMCVLNGETPKDLWKKVNRPKPIDWRPPLGCLLPSLFAFSVRHAIHNYACIHVYSVQYIYLQIGIGNHSKGGLRAVTGNILQPTHLGELLNT